jgi:tRNA threonylcarbamoyl adenosine modification protein YjeE
LILPNRRATTRLGIRIAKIVQPGEWVLLVGGLGSGKTFLARAIARGLGVPSDVAVPSPTFTLVQEYELEGGRTLLHVDLYRIRDNGRTFESDVARLGLRERMKEGAIVLVEWGNEVVPHLGAPALRIELTTLSESARRAEFSGPRADVAASGAS